MSTMNTDNNSGADDRDREADRTDELMDWWTVSPGSGVKAISWITEDDLRMCMYVVYVYVCYKSVICEISE